jgi:hypothetical protein
MMHERKAEGLEVRTGQTQSNLANFTEEQLLDFYLDLSRKARDEYFVDTASAAEMAGVTQRTIQLWIEGGLVCAVYIAGKFKVTVHSLKQYLKERAMKHRGF